MKSVLIRFLLLTTLVCPGLVACQTDYMEFDTSRHGVYFSQDSLLYSFGVTPVEVNSYLLKVPFRTMGTVSQTSRTVSFRVIAEESDAVAGLQYELGNAVVEPGETEGYIPVTLLRSGLEGNFTEGYHRYRLTLRLTESSDFQPTLNEAKQTCVLKFDNAVKQPEWLTYDGSKVWPTYSLGQWHPYKLIKMVEQFHSLEATMPETYERIASMYGENLENIPFGDPYEFKTIFNKYIFKPMYDYFSDPAHREEILEVYPDFPFDMPNPFA